MDQQTWFPKTIVADQVYSKDDLAAMWNVIDWSSVRESVFQQQCRIARAALERKIETIPVLQDELVNSDEAKALAVWEVTHRKSRNSPGVDGIVWETPAQWMSAALHLNTGVYESLPLYRFYIPKESGKLRPLGISAMQDRAMQMLYTFALQPVAETWGDPHSFGYRLYRSARDAGRAIRQFLSASRNDEVWVLDADITGCFDNIRHDWLLKHIPVSRAFLKQVLKSGYIDDGNYYPTTRGVPQGGIISPVLANMTLDCLEPRLMKAFGQGDSSQPDQKADRSALRFVRYADDFVLLTISRSVAEEAWDEVNTFLRPRGLILSDEKTRIVTARDGFSFLHWRFRAGDAGESVRPSDASAYHIRHTLKEFFEKKEFPSPTELIRNLNPLLRGYAYYHRDVEAGELFHSLDECIRKKILKLIAVWFPNERPGLREKRFFVRSDTGPPQFSAGTELLYILSSTSPGMPEVSRTDLNPFLDRDILVHDEQQTDGLDRAVLEERKRCREEGRKYGTPEYW